MRYARPVASLIEHLEKLPGVGPKSAQRLAFHILRASQEENQRLAEAILEVKVKTRYCQRCFNFSEEDLCPICQDTRRDQSVICVVADPRDLTAIENSGEFRGLYHVLQGLLSPMEGILPDKLRIRELKERLQTGTVKEVILAMNPTVEGDTTALFLNEEIKPLGVKVTQLAMGLPVGGDLDYADQVTIARAVAWRREV
jgi:recombination protein RecR